MVQAGDARVSGGCPRACRPCCRSDLVCRRTQKCAVAVLHPDEKNMASKATAAIPASSGAAASAPAAAVAIAIHTSALSATPSTGHGPLLSKEVKLDELSKYFHLPEKAVAKELGICLTSLKKLCRSYGITRWPFRKLKSLERTMRKVQTVCSRVPLYPERVCSLCVRARARSMLACAGMQ